MTFDDRRLFDQARLPLLSSSSFPLGAPGTALVKKDHRLMGRDFKALLTGLAGYIIIHSDEVIS